MLIPNLASSKKRKDGQHFEFQTFCSSARSTCAFQDSIQTFLRECTEDPTKTSQNMLFWCAPLVHETSKELVPLYIIEDPANQSQHPCCKHCVHSDDEWNKPLGDDFNRIQNHIFHGLIHCNGFGHLLIINGAAGGSKYLSGREIMDLWDRICTNLQTRKSTTEDLSRKWSVDLRLLFRAAYGHSWFAKWGYTFCPDNYGVTHGDYNEGINRLYLWELNNIVHDFSNREGYEEIKRIINHYRNMSESLLVTLGALLTFMLTIRFQAPLLVQEKIAVAPSSTSKPSTETVQEKSLEVRSLGAATADGKWAVELATEIIKDTLKRMKAVGSGCGGISRKVLRHAVRAMITDTGLLDYVLKSLDNVIVENYVICRTKN